MFWGEIGDGNVYVGFLLYRGFFFWYLIFNLEEKYVLEVKSEVLDVNVLWNGVIYGIIYENLRLLVMSMIVFLLYCYYLVFVSMYLI